MIRRSGWFAIWIVSGLGWALAQPSLLEVSPWEGAPGTQVRLEGFNLRQVNRVSFHQHLADFQAVNDETIIAIVPRLATTGPIRLEGSGGGFVTSGSFLVAPRIFDFAPARSATNSVIAVFGENFQAVQAVLFGERPAAFTTIGAQQLAVRVPFGVTQAVIRVQTPAGAAASAMRFEATGLGPWIDRFQPTVAAPGETVIVDGANFATATTVQINGVAAPQVAVVSPSQLHVVVPAAGTTGLLRVTTAAGTATTAGALTVTRAPVIQTFSPSVAAAGGSVTVEGLHLQEVTGVTFNGVAATGFGSVAQNQLTAIVPPGATTGPIRVANRFGVGISAEVLTVTRAPIVSALSQEAARAGERITLTGVNFTGATRVRFGSREAIPSVVADSQLHVDVPVGATTGPVHVVSGFGAGTSTQALRIIGLAPDLVAAEPSSGARGTPVVLHGYNFERATEVRFGGVLAPFVVTSGTQILTEVPPTAAAGQIRVRSGTGVSTNDVVFFVPPRVTVEPVRGKVGETVELGGANLVGVTRVRVDEVDWSFSAKSSNRVEAVIAPATRHGRLSIDTPAGTFTSTNTFLVAPHVIGFAPGAAGGGTTLTVTGTGLFDVQAVTVGGVAAAFTARTAEELVATVPAGAGSGPVRVVTRGGEAVSEAVFVETGPSEVRLESPEETRWVELGTELTRNVSVRVEGPFGAPRATVTITLPSGLSLVEVDAPGDACRVAGQTVICDYTALEVGARLDLRLKFRAEAEGVWTNRVQLSELVQDPEAGNNAVEWRTLVASTAGRTLELVRDGSDRWFLQWSARLPGWVVEVSEGLGATAVWVDAGLSPERVGDRYRVVLPRMGWARYYRLRQGGITAP